VCGAVSPALVYLEKFTSLSDQLIRLSTKYKIQAAQEKLRFIYCKNGRTNCAQILDMIMPGMGGGKTFDYIREKCPQMPVVLSSGYTMNGQAEKIMNRGCDGFIQKPFSVYELSQKIRKILDKKTTSS